MSRITDIPLFASLGPAEVARFDPQCRWRTFEANSAIVDYDDLSTDVRFIVSGRVRVIFRSESGKEVILGECGPGEMFGEMAAIDGKPRSAHVLALHRTRVATLAAPVFLDILAASPEASRAVLTLLVARIRSLNARLAEHAFLTARQRLYCELLRLSRPRKGHDGERVVSPPPNQTDLANRIGSRREVVSREISALEKAAIVEKTRGGLVLCDPAELNRRISAALGE